MAQTKQNGAPTPSFQMPKGMMRIGSISNAPWWLIANGNKLVGILENVYERPDERAKSGKSKFFQIRLLEETRVTTGRAKERKESVAPVGTIVNLNYGPKTKDLENLIPDIVRGAEYKVLCYVNGDKFDIGKGQTMWPIEVGAEQTRAPKASDEDPDFDGVEDEAAGGAEGAQA